MHAVFIENYGICNRFLAGLWIKLGTTMTPEFVSAQVALAQATALTVEEGFVAFIPTATAYTWAIGKFPTERLHIIPVLEIDPPLRSVGVPLFPRAAPIFAALRDGVALPPLEVELLPSARGPYRYRVRDGFHRYYLVCALGFALLPAIVWPYFDLDVN